MKPDIIFEVIPPAKNVSSAYAEKFVDRIVSAIGEMHCIRALNIPEIVEENHIGMPFYRNADNREFGVSLRERCKKEIMLNTVVGYYNTKGSFEQWLDESADKYGIKDFIFVGAKISSIKYPGPSVIDANLIAKKKAVNFGNIFIPERENEAERLISKTIAGCSFFTSQVLFESEALIKILNDYSEKCEKLNIKPAKFYLSLSPVSRLEDVRFIKGLGAEIGLATENRLKSAQNIDRESVKMLKELSYKVLENVESSGLKIPLGLNIEYITLHNLELTKDLIKEINTYN
jgi:hypothetical protein